MPTLRGDRTILVTGGTGTLGGRLVDRLASSPGASVVVLTRVARAAASGAALPRVQFVVGDLRKGYTLGVDAGTLAELRGRITDIVHCAADTTFNRPLPESRATNVDGARAILDFAADCPRLERVACFSTVYVAGRSTGCFGEAGIGGEAGFVNNYEQSTWEMEAVVRAAMPRLPIALYRLRTIIGDSGSGAVSGFNAVSHSWSGFISPSPLKRWIETDSRFTPSSRARSSMDFNSSSSSA